MELREKVFIETMKVGKFSSSMSNVSNERTYGCILLQSYHTAECLNQHEKLLLQALVEVHYPQPTSFAYSPRIDHKNFIHRLCQ